MYMVKKIGKSKRHTGSIKKKNMRRRLIGKIMNESDYH